MRNDDVSALGAIDLKTLALDYQSRSYKHTRIIHADCFEWLGRLPENSLHAIVTDPPYGVKEYDFDQLEKKENGNGGIWRLPPSFDGHVRSPLPRFTALDRKERDSVDRFFVEWGRQVMHALRPGGHVFLASNAFQVAMSLVDSVNGSLDAVSFGFAQRGGVLRGQFQAQGIIRSAPDMLIAAVTAVSRGDRYVDAQTAQALALAQVSGDTSPAEILSEREFSVFIQLARGQTVALIAETLRLSPSTVGTHLYRVKQKLGASNQSELTLVALRWGLIQA